MTVDFLLNVAMTLSDIKMVVALSTWCTCHLNDRNPLCPSLTWLWPLVSITDMIMTLCTQHWHDSGRLYLTDIIMTLCAHHWHDYGPLRPVLTWLWPFVPITDMIMALCAKYWHDYDHLCPSLTCYGPLRQVLTWQWPLMPITDMLWPFVPSTDLTVTLCAHHWHWPLKYVNDPFFPPW